MSQTDALGYHVTVGFRCGKFDIHGLMACFGLSDKIGQCEVGIWACHQVGMVPFHKFLLSTFSHAA